MSASGASLACIAVSCVPVFHAGKSLCAISIQPSAIVAALHLLCYALHNVLRNKAHLVTGPINVEVQH